MKKLLNIFILGSIVLLSSCKKEKTTWQTDWNVPLVHGNMTLNDLVKDHAAENTDNFASLFYEDTAYSFKIDTLIKLPDTILVQDAVISFPSLTLGPGNLIQNQNIDQLYDLGQIQLKRVMVLDGEATITITSPWPGKSKVIFEFPKTLDGEGNMFQKEYHMPAGSLSNPSVISEDIDMKNFDFDLTGSTGDLYNNILANMYIYSDEETNSITITNQDTVRVKLDFHDMTAKYAKGYFGEYELMDTTTLNIIQMKQIISGSIGLDSVNLNLDVQNGFKLITQATFNRVRGINTQNGSAVDLTFPQLGTALNINPASGGLYGYTPSSFNIPINSANSNVLAFIENLPDEIEIAFKIHINPYGNTTGGDDEYFPGSSLDLMLDADMPLHYSADQLTIADTMAFSYDENESVTPKSAIITVDYENGFPMGASAEIHLLDTDLQFIQSIETSSQIDPGTYNSSNVSTTPVAGKMIFTLDESTVENLKITKHLALLVSFSTDQQSMVKINIDDYFDFNIFSDLNLKITF